MEALLQYRRIQRATIQELENVTSRCTTGSDIEAGSSCQTLSPSADGSANATKANEKNSVIIVGWASAHDELNPANWPTAYKVSVTFLVSLIGSAVTAASAIDASGTSQYMAEFHTTEAVSALPTGIFMIGLAFGSMLSGPFSETFGRTAVYISTLTIYLLFIMAAALAPNLGAHLAFRFLAGLFGATPLTCSGGTVADLWAPLQKAYAFLIFAVPAFAGPALGQLVGAFIPPALGWRWLEWVMLIAGGAVLVAVVVLLPETYGDLLLYWKAAALRERTGDERYKAPMEVRDATLSHRLLVALYRPFLWSYTEAILLLFSLYLTIVWTVLFMFLEGYRFVFGGTYGLSQGLVGITWAGMLVGMICICALAPVVYAWTGREYRRTSRIRPETRLWYAMSGAPLLSVGLFWMGWTANPSVSIWSPLAASAFVGYGMIAIFVSAYMYVIDSYGPYAASGLGFMSFTRYLVSGGVMIAGSAIYERYGVHYTLSVLGAITAVLAPIPYGFYYYGPTVRKRSRHTVVQD